MAGSSPGMTVTSQRKIPPCGGTFLLSPGPATELAILVGVILVGVLSLTVRILLLLAGLLTAALLLAGLLVRILVLLAGIRVLVRHRRSPLLNVVRNNPKARRWFPANPGSAVIIAW